MNIQEYRLDTSSGELYTEVEFFNQYWFIYPDNALIQEKWGECPVIEVPEGKLEETKEKLKYLYTPIRSYRFGVHGLGTLGHPGIFCSDPTKTLKLVQNKPK